jgi:hypothetical protein
VGYTAKTMEWQMKKSRQKRDIAIDPSKPARVLGMLEDFREKYATNWSRDAVAFEADGHYAWMSYYVDGFDRVLEVGSGDGRSTVDADAKLYQKSE